MKRSDLMLRATGMAFFAAGLAFASAIQAQETPGQTRARATTQSLNQGPADTELSTRPTAAPLAESGQRPARTLTDVLNQTAGTEPDVSANPVISPPPRPAASSARTDAPVETLQAAAPDIEVLADLPLGPPSALPPLPLGYYVRGDMDCNQIWPGEGNLAWLSASAFTIDFGGCDPGQIQQISDTLWREDQRCQTELGGDAGVFSVDYEAASPTILTTSSRLGGDPTVTRDNWTHCAAEDLPPEARFHPEDPGRAT